MDMLNSKGNENKLLKQHLEKTKNSIKPTQILVIEGTNYQTKEKKYVRGLVNVLKIGLTLNIETPLVGRLCQYLYEVEHPSEIAKLVEVRETNIGEVCTQWQWSPFTYSWLKLNEEINSFYQK